MKDGTKQKLAALCNTVVNQECSDESAFKLFDFIIREMPLSEWPNVEMSGVAVTCSGAVDFPTTLIATN